MMRGVAVPAALVALVTGLGIASAKFNCADTCALIAKVLPGTVAYPNSTLYLSENNYWSNRQKEVHPECFVSPRSSTEVARVVQILTSTRSPFTVKSGGHTSFAGGSNIDGGVTIDLRQLDAIAVSADRQTVSVGPGNRWIDVSDALAPLGLAVVAGRVADVGVAGLVLGGGISYFSGLRGWACDNVRAFEVVLASGRVVTASPTVHRDLYRALRGGGGSSFGVVTRFDLDAFPQGDLWTGTRIFPGALNASLIPAFVDLTLHGLPADPEAHTYFVSTFQPALGGFIALASFYHATPPSPPDATPPVFAPFDAFSPVVAASAGAANISAQSMAIDEPYGARQTWWCTSVKATSATLLVDIVLLFEAVANALLAAAAASGTTLTPYLVFQPISTNILQHMQKNGGNALGLSPERDGPLMIVQLSATWDDPGLDGLVEDSYRQLIESVDALAKARGLYKGFVYMNYAGRTQHVLKSYGKENYEILRATAKKWDPKGHFQELWKGYFQV